MRGRRCVADASALLCGVQTSLSIGNSLSTLPPRVLASAELCLLGLVVCVAIKHVDSAQCFPVEILVCSATKHTGQQPARCVRYFQPVLPDVVTSCWLMLITRQLHGIASGYLVLFILVRSLSLWRHDCGTALKGKQHSVDNHNSATRMIHSLLPVYRP